MHTAAPTVTEAASPPSIAGDWVMTRTVVATDEGAPYTVGESEQRYLRIADGTCADGRCAGTLITAQFEAGLDDGTGSELGYTWDGTTLVYTPEPSTYDCSAADGTLTLAGAYDVTFDVQLSADDATPTGFSGPVVLTFAPAPATVDQLPGLDCPVVDGSTTFDARVVRR